MNWYKQTQVDLQGNPLEFRQEVEAPTYNALISEKPMSWYDHTQDKEMTGTVKQYYNDMKKKRGRIEQMSPDEYIDHCINEMWLNDPELRKQFNSQEELKERILGYRTQSIDDEGRSLLEKYKEMWLQGNKPPLPYIIYRGKEKEYFGQEGFHRALAAKELGVASMPVLIIEENWDS